ncbi:MAG: hypothetical protein Kow002_12730 [Anaerolineales bacterium]
MSEFNFDEPAAGASSGFRPGVWDILTILVLAITLCIGITFLTIFVNPGVAWNPFKPAGYGLPEPTITPLQMPPTWTPEPTIEPTATNTPLPTLTIAPTNTPVLLVPPTNTPKPTATPTLTKTPTLSPTPRAPFSSGEPIYIASTIIHPEQACNWLGVGGTVDDQNNSPIVGIVIRLTGRLNGKNVDMTNLSGINLEYGKSGFEFFLGTIPVNSRDDLYVQLLDQAGLPLSEKVYINTYNDCERNLVLVRFKKNR